MCLAAVVGLVGAGISAAGQMQQAKLQEQIGERNAKMEAARGRYEARQLGRKLDYTQSQARVNGAASGRSATGSFLDIIADNAIQGEIDIDNTLRNSFNRQGSIRYEAQAGASRSRASAANTIISGIGNAYEQTTDYMRLAG
jgi:hypothetical protein